MAQKRPSPRPVPRRIPPLRWRQPAFLWTPAALALALGWPALALREDAGLPEVVAIAGALAFAVGFLSLGCAWAIGRPPRTRRAVILHLLWPGAVAALAAPFVYRTLVVTIAIAQSGVMREQIPLQYAMAAEPLALLVGLPIVLLSALVFALVALVKPARAEWLTS